MTEEIVARVVSWSSGRERLYDGQVLYGRKTIFRAEERPTEAQARADVVDWCVRMGKKPRWEGGEPARVFGNGNGTANNPILAAAVAAGKPNQGLQLAVGPHTLSRDDKQILAECETVIARGLKIFLEVGRALLTVRDQRLYRYRFGTFEDYVRERWEMSARHAHRLCDAAEVVEDLQKAAPAKPLPANESQARELARLPRAERPKVWAQVVTDAPGGKVTAQAVEAAVQKRLAPPEHIVLEPKGSFRKGLWPKPNEHGVFEKGAETLKFEQRGARASIELLQIGTSQWIAAYGYHYPHLVGACGSSCPLTARRSFPDRKTVLEVVAGDLRDAQSENLQAGGMGGNRRCAELIREWAARLIAGDAIADSTPEGRVGSFLSGTLAPDKPEQRLLLEQIEPSSKPTDPKEEILLEVSRLLGRLSDLEQTLRGRREAFSYTNVARAAFHLKKLVGIYEVDGARARRKMSAAHRARLSALAKARWLKAKAPGTNALRKQKPGRLRSRA